MADPRFFRVAVEGDTTDGRKITRQDNLSIYYQDGKQRRLIQDEPKLDQVTDYNSSNEAYVIEDLDCACLVENIEAMPAD